MKKNRKIIVLLLASAMVLSFAACGKSNRYTSSNIPKDDEQIDFSSYVTPVNTVPPTATPTTAPQPTPTPVPSPTPTPTPVPTTVVVNSGYVNITKSPTSETVDAGGSASFVAYGNNFSSIQWIVANPDSSVIYDASNAPAYFPGLVVNGQGTSFLKLSNIPYDLNGWKVQAIFNGSGGPLYTNIAYITVKNVSSEEIIAKDFATTCKDIIAASASTIGFSSSGITAYTYISPIGDFSVNFTLGTKTVYAEFLSDYTNSSCIPLSIKVFDGSTDVTDIYPLYEQTMDAFYDVLTQIAGVLS